jgi:type IV pilus assembly protein PilA
VESLIVIIVIGVLAAIAIPLYLAQRDSANHAVVKEGAHLIQTGVIAYAVDHRGAHPATEYVTCTPTDASADGLGDRYLDTRPRKPRTGQPMVGTRSNVLLTTHFDNMSGLTPLIGTGKSVDGKLVSPFVRTALGRSLVRSIARWGTRHT